MHLTPTNSKILPSTDEIGIYWDSVGYYEEVTRFYWILTPWNQIYFLCFTEVITEKEGKTYLNAHS